MKRIISITTILIIILSLCSCVKTYTDINNYANDVKKYKAELFMPDLEKIGDYKNIEYFSRKDNGLFPAYSIQLLVDYEEADFLKEKERLYTAYTYLDKPQQPYLNAPVYTIPIEKFSAYGFDFRVAIFDDTIYPENFGIVGLSDEKCQVLYLWLYSPDLDYICEYNENEVKAMCEFFEHYFSLNCI